MKIVWDKEKIDRSEGRHQSGMTTSAPLFLFPQCSSLCAESSLQRKLILVFVAGLGPFGIFLALFLKCAQSTRCTGCKQVGGLFKTAERVLGILVDTDVTQSIEVAELSVSGTSLCCQSGDFIDSKLNTNAQK